MALGGGFAPAMPRPIHAGSDQRDGRRVDQMNRRLEIRDDLIYYPQPTIQTSRRSRGMGNTDRALRGAAVHATADDQFYGLGAGCCR